MNAGPGDDLWSARARQRQGDRLHTLRSLEKPVGEDEEDDQLIRPIVDRARAFLLDHDWCNGVSEVHVGDVSIGGIVAVLLCRIEPPREDIDEWL